MNVKSRLRGPIAPQNMGRTFFIFCFVSTIQLQLQLRSCLEQTVPCFSALSTLDNIGKLHPDKEFPNIPLFCEDDLYN